MVTAQDNKLTGSAQSQRLEELQDLFEVVAKGKRIWETTFDAIVDPVLVVTPEYQISRANTAAGESSGEDVRNLVGKTCYEVFAKRETPCVGCPMEASRLKQTPRKKRLQPFVDGREFAASAFPIRDKEGEAVGLSVMQYQDMSAIRKLEAQVMQNEKMAALGQFASGIAHDINNPLSGVLAFAQLALQGVEKGSQSYQDIKEIEVSALRCKSIVENLLNFSKPISSFDQELVDLGEIVKKTLPNLLVQFKDSNVNLKKDLRKLPLVLASESKFQQVFTNILSNAFQAISKDGEVYIRCGEEEDMVYIDISDNGEGISKENLNSIFDPYFTTKEKRGGTGLGLPTTYNIVREYGGRIIVKSELGKGTSFRVFVPKGEINEKPYSRS